MSSRSAPYAWERVTGEEVRVSIGGHELPFTSTSAKPVFASDLSGAEWTVAAEVRAGAVALVLTAPDQSGASDTVESVTITNPGSGYASVPTVTFEAPPAGGTTATGAAAGLRRFGDGRDRRERLRGGSQRDVRGAAVRRHYGDRRRGGGLRLPSIR